MKTEYTKGLFQEISLSVKKSAEAFSSLSFHTLSLSHSLSVYLSVCLPVLNSLSLSLSLSLSRSL